MTFHRRSTSLDTATADCDTVLTREQDQSLGPAVRMLPRCEKPARRRLLAHIRLSRYSRVRMPETRSSTERFRRWTLAHPSEFVAIAFCAIAVPLAAVGAVSQSVLNAAILAVLAVLAVELLRRRGDEKYEIASSVVSELARSSARVEVLDSPERVYAESMHLIRYADPQEAADRVIRIASLRSAPPGRYDALPRTLGLMEEVYAKLAHGWTVRRIVNVRTVERLDWELANQPPGKPRYELRVYVGDPLPMLTPLIIGRHHALVARHDPQGVGVLDATDAEASIRGLLKAEGDASASAEPPRRVSEA